MITTRTFIAMWLSILLALTAESVFAIPFTPVLDEFWIIKDSTEIYRDSFTDNTPPPSGPDGATTYSVQGPDAMTSESGGKLTMTPALGETTAITGTSAEKSTATIRLLATNPLNDNFLGIDNSFEIHGLYDMSNLPMVSGQSFGIRAIDRALGLGNLGDNTYPLFVGINPNTGDTVVSLRHNDYVTNISTVVGSVSIQSLLAGAQQIDLGLSKAAGSDQITASFTLYGMDQAILGSGIVGTGTIYIGENYIRAGFQSTDIVPVPEPPTLALVGLGLIGLFIVRKRKV